VLVETQAIAVAGDAEIAIGGVEIRKIGATAIRIEQRDEHVAADERIELRDEIGRRPAAIVRQAARIETA
jgi:hypothetical protein